MKRFLYKGNIIYPADVSILANSAEEASKIVRDYTRLQDYIDIDKAYISIHRSLGEFAHSMEDVEVEWDFDDEDDIIANDLDTIIPVPIEVYHNPDECAIADWISDNYGWCVKSVNKIVKK